MAFFDVRDTLDAVPAKGCHISVRLSAKHLDAYLAVANAASWRIPELDVEQSSFQHRGFRGRVQDFVRRMESEVREAKSRYPAAAQRGFDGFLERVEAVLEGRAGELTLDVRDPSGMSTAGACLAAEVHLFERQVQDDFSLGVQYPRPKQRSGPQDVARLVRKAQRVVALTGAGISVESGITPFRTTHETGPAIWGEFDATKMTVKNFNTDEGVRTMYWSMERKLFAEFDKAYPNRAHQFFALLEEQQKLHAVITQNIDSLHQRGGVSPEKVSELHGHMRRVVCSNFVTSVNTSPYSDGTCRYSCHYADVMAGAAVPLCPECGAPLRTESVMFEEPLPVGAMEKARADVASSDLLIVVGSSLVVRPANELPAEALRRGIPVVMVNLDSTQYDENAHALVWQPAAEFFAKVSAALAEEEDEDALCSTEEENSVDLRASCMVGQEPQEEDSEDELLYGDDDFLAC